MNKTKNRIKAIGLAIIIFSLLNAGSRLAFTRTNNMLKIPTTSPYEPTTLLTIGTSAEMYKIDPQNQTGGLFFNTYLNPKFNLGISAISYADTSKYIEEDSTVFKAVNETGIHLQYTAYTKDDISIAVGIQDILIRRGQNIDQKGISLYAVFSSHRTFEDYELGSYLGFGNGKIAEDTGLDSVSSAESSSGVFLGFSLNTPYMQEHGGIDIMAEYDGSGLNIGMKIPITNEYKAMLGITHFENFGEFGTQSDELLAAKLKTDAPAIAIGFAMTIPSKENKEQLRKRGAISKTSKPSIGREDPYLMLRDSLKYNKYQIKNLSEYNAQIEQQLKTLMDSTRKQELEKQIYKSNLNKTMQHLSKSLRQFYSGEYMIALQEIEIALQLNPELAITYARRGTIFYKLGEQQKAIINWNLALQLDPGYEEIREILEAAKEGKLETLPKQKQPGGL